MKSRLAGTILAGCLLVTACGSDGSEAIEPSTWSNDFARVSRLVPETLGELDDDAREQACGEGLGRLRAAREDLFPAPTDELESAATTWIDRAEGMLFECPGGDDLAAAQAEVEDARQEVEQLLAEAS